MSSNILVVDDEADMLLMLRFSLEMEGYAVKGVASAEEALMVLSRDAPDTILLDLSLPGMDGWEFLRHLRSSRWADLPVILLTAHASPSVEKRATELGCSSYLTKPFSLKDLLAALAAILDSS